LGARQYFRTASLTPAQFRSALLALAHFSELRVIVAGRRDAPPDVLHSLAIDADAEVRVGAMANPTTPDSDRLAYYKRLVDGPSALELEAIPRDTLVPAAAFELLAGNEKTQWAAALNPRMPLAVLHALAASKNAWVAALARERIEAVGRQP
jgi:hypothetical protein